MKQFRDTPYYVTENGEVYSNFHNKLRRLNPCINPDGYYKLNLSINGKIQTFRIHRLVAECFIPNPNNLPLVEHRDDIKTNNHVSNLMWSTNNENMKTAIQNNRIKKGAECYKSKLSEQDVIWIRKNYIPRHLEFGEKQLAKKFNVTTATISLITRNKTWNHLNPE